MLRKLKSKRWILFWRAVIEIAGIVFLFYSNLLMGEFNGRAGRGKTWGAALEDIFTRKNVAIALVTATVGFAVWEMFRKWLDEAGKDSGK
jgi:hypothetical protein